MDIDSGKSRSLWMTTAEVPEESPLAEDMQADVCIIGAGIVGISTAYLLIREGKRVVVLDDGPLAGGVTCRTTAHLSNAIDDRYTEMERLHGETGARLAAESHTHAIAQIEANVRQEHLECDFTRLDGYLFPAERKHIDLLKEELEAAHRAGLRAVELLPRAPLNTFDTGPCLRFPEQGQFHPLKYLTGLIRAAKTGGGRFFTATHVDKIEGGAQATVHTTKGPIVTASSVIVATNTPINDLLTIHTKQFPYRSYVIAAPVPPESVVPALYWDTADPYHYVRLQRAENSVAPLLIVGGEDHKTGQADDADERYGRLEAWARERFPTMGRIDYRWSGQIMESMDGLAFIGKNPMDTDNVYIATGDSGMGMTHGTIAGILLTDLILGRPNPWTSLYDPSRVSLRATSEFVRENVNVALQYGKLLSPGTVSSLEAIAAGTGAIVREGLKKMAVYRDEKGDYHRMSALCPHLGCVVAWNTSEKTWDCPCHGSRFTCDGRVVNGPASSNLEPI